jgi:hypothetical protein
VNQIQMQAAKRVMIEWLKHPQELGKEPEQIRYAGTFDLYGMHYYLFKYKRGRMGKWLLGVSGGFVEDELENCGHVYSEMQEYHEETAKEDAIVLIETVRAYWKEQAERGEQQKENAGSFLAFVLLERTVWDKEAFKEQLKNEWEIEETAVEDLDDVVKIKKEVKEIEDDLESLEGELDELEKELARLEKMFEEGALEGEDELEEIQKGRIFDWKAYIEEKNANLKNREEEDLEYEDWSDEDMEESEDMLVFHYEGAIISIALMQGPVPNGEAENHAQRNFRWPDAEKTVRRHEAHLMVAVLAGELSAVEAGELMVKILMLCCRLPETLGIYMNETVYEPEMYLQMAEMLQHGMFPVLNLIWIGLYQGERGICGYTCGMRAFGYDEMEVVDSQAEPGEVYSFLVDLADFVIMEDELLQDGETVGFSEEEKLPITKSRGNVVEGETLKIEFHGES